ncbi:DnaB-like helicase N-terminal domain-containing protein [Streptomyces sp. UNOB3_S3]|uniref:DnaB-like helicase N-terminal domain-containing protein n=1 Tax=Streptomyces sp. UNOB3_S3 TaxID=2871682 RepID=UPI001E6584DC|nr:DnaB-like helicase N-terminal domain-containing protein [Streptomyces sp. UNOB3_S3]MCC3778209.1 replicative DNA helicase [Streptomyces sp. UNOB3_S3]
MPDSTSPQLDPGREGPVPPQPVHYAEQALLGALLLDPQQLKTIAALEPGHFGDHSHAALFAAMRALPPPAAEAHAREPVWLNAVLHAARPQAPGLSAAYLHSLVHACPWAGHAATYARMIRADHARRTLRLHAQRLAQATTDTTAPNPAITILAEADALTRFLDDLAGQFAPHPGSLPRTPLAAIPAWDTGEEALSEERLLLASAIAHPDEFTTMRWLQADDFALPLHAALFQCLSALAHRGDPVDTVTVLWEAQHHGLLSADIAPADLMNLVSTPVGSPEYWGERLLQRALLTQARATGLRIQAITDDSANSPHQLITGSRRALANLTKVRARWQCAATPTTPPTRPGSPRAPATTRAGPPRVADLPASTAPRVTRYPHPGPGQHAVRPGR